MSKKPLAPRLALNLGAGGAALAAIGAYGSGFGFWDFTIGFIFVLVGVIAAVIAILSAVVALWTTRNTGGTGLLPWVGAGCGIVLFGTLGSWIGQGRGAPMLHDVTTNSASPPAFQTLKLRPDNLVGVKTIENWRKIHDAAFADIKPVIMAKSLAETMGIVKRLVTERGWEVAAITTDRIEATDTVSPFKFRDDVVIVATPEADGKSTRIDVRSTSRVGIGDLGVNAKRIRGLLADLKAADTRTP